ncbi:SigE family RNA polymerase sigma factor [Yinghuangia seranimata]|uniref:SigE family RNA polymerase sigma factor n=1 Tax=Yinghuangia seranimata TaxID=408067 RepID=UPI00248AA4E6|nr:SigE family RNA polymerase sigma factor [Yinghuangia seranimata]MDI2126027.1 SigE family RNA polymerase sigma factor [Yinghuangia seranimata]
MVWRRRDPDGFTDFVEAIAGRLRRTAYLLCGDWHLAEDLMQIALEKVYVAWRKVERTGNPEAYAKRVLVNAYLDRRRRKSFAEVPGVEPVDLEFSPAPDRGDADLRLTLLAALRELGPRDRAVLILRYWDDYSIEDTAELLGVSVSAVKSTGSRGLARLRDRLGDPDVLTRSPN